MKRHDDERDTQAKVIPIEERRLRRVEISLC
jgi:hypothetical protein